MGGGGGGILLGDSDAHELVVAIKCLWLVESLVRQARVDGCLPWRDDRSGRRRCSGHADRGMQLANAHGRRLAVQLGTVRGWRPRYQKHQRSEAAAIVGAVGEWTAENGHIRVAIIRAGRWGYGGGDEAGSEELWPAVAAELKLKCGEARRPQLNGREAPCSQLRRRGACVAQLVCSKPTHAQLVDRVTAIPQLGRSEAARVDELRHLMAAHAEVTRAKVELLQRQCGEVRESRHVRGERYRRPRWGPAELRTAADALWRRSEVCEVDARVRRAVLLAVGRDAYAERHAKADRAARQVGRGECLVRHNGLGSIGRDAAYGVDGRGVGDGGDPVRSIPQ